MDTHLSLVEHQQLASTILTTVLVFAACLLSLIVVGVILSERMDDDGNY